MIKIQVHKISGTRPVKVYSGYVYVYNNENKFLYSVKCEADRISRYEAKKDAENLKKRMLAE